jgi:hypothetical protein
METIQPKTKVRLQAALDAYRDTFAIVEDIRDVNNRAVDVARQIRDTYFPKGESLELPPLPPQFDPSKRPYEDAVRALHESNLPRAVKLNVYEAMEDFQMLRLRNALDAGNAEKIEQDIRIEPGILEKFFGKGEQ